MGKNTLVGPVGRWCPTGMSGGGGTEAGAISPHDPRFIILNSDMSGVFISRDGGRTWRIIPFQQLNACPLCAPVFHPSDPLVIYAACGYAGEMRVSRDGGITWRAPGHGAPDGLLALAVDPRRPDRIVAGHRLGASLSNDAGNTWVPLSGVSEPVRYVCFSGGRRNEDAAIFVVTASAVFRSSDERHACRRLDGGWGDGRIVSFAAGSSVDGASVLYAWLADNGGDARGSGAIRVSCDNGETWISAADMSPHPDVPTAGELPLGYLLANDIDPDRVYAVKKRYSAADTVWRSDDRGRTWSPIAFCDRSDPRFNMPPDYINCFFNSLWGWDITHAASDRRDADHLMFAHYCTGFITSDGGRTWKSQSTQPAGGQPALSARSRWLNNGLTITTTWNYYVDPFAPDRHFIAYTDIGLAVSSDGGESWVLRRDTCVNTYELAFDPSVKGRIWAAFGMTHDIPNNNIILNEHPSKGNGCVGCSEDGGETWTDLIVGGPVKEASFYRSDYGADWRERSGLPPATVVSIVLDPRSPPSARVLYASLWLRGVYRSSDGGRTWTNRSEGLGPVGLPPCCLRLQVHPDGALFCLLTTRLKGGELIRDGVGLYRSRDEGLTWTDITAGLDVRWTTDFVVDPRDSGVIYLSVADHLIQATSGWREGKYVPSGGLYKTTDGGATWERIARKCSRHFAATLHPDNPDWVYMTVHATVPEDRANPPEASLWLSRDGGGTWTPFLDYPFGNPARVHFHPVDGKMMYVTSYGGSVYRGPVAPEQDLRG